MTGSTHDRIRARGIALDWLTSLTIWIGLGALAVLGAFIALAAATIPGHASPGGSASDSASTDQAPLPSPVAETRHHHDDSSGSISAPSGPAIVVSGGSH